MQTSWSALKRKELRRHRRYAVDASVLQVFWLGSDGKRKMARTRALNISESGMAIELPEGAAPMSLVRFESAKFRIAGSAAVRHCRREGTRFIVGMEFCDGLRWVAPEGDVIEPIPLCQTES
jgi:hypothetical protein